MSSKRVIEFCFDIVCPYAYIASHRVATVAARCDAKLIWQPVLLGGLYKLTNAAQGKDGSATDIMSPVRQRISSLDMLREAERAHAPLRFNSKHPQKSLNCQRLLTLVHHSQKAKLAAALYKHYWQDDGDIVDVAVLLSIAEKVGVKNLKPTDITDNEQVKKQLFDVTSKQVERGAFGVPFFWCENESKATFFWGQDRLHFVERFFGNPLADVPRLKPNHLPLNGVRKRVRFFFDVASPWSALGFLSLTRLERVANVELVPVLLGALFVAIGTQNTPAARMSPPQLAWAQRDLALWNEFWSGSEPLLWPDHFPLRTVTAQRVAILNEATVAPLFDAAWRHNKNISDTSVLIDVLNDAGFDGQKLVEDTNNMKIKQKLKDNTALAISLGACGVPTYEIDGELVFGQDRIGVIEDLACGWNPQTKTILLSNNVSKL